MRSLTWRSRVLRLLSKLLCSLVPVLALGALACQESTSVQPSGGVTTDTVGTTTADMASTAATDSANGTPEASSDTPASPPLDTPTAPLDAAETTATTGPTFHGDVLPILASKCQGCHLEGGIAPFPLLTYAQVKPLATLIATTTAALRMPPFDVSTGANCEPRLPYLDDIRLSDAERATLEVWSKNGAAEGTPSATPPVPKAIANLKKVDLEAIPAQDYSVEGSADDFVCFVIDPGFKESKYIKGIHFVADNAKVAHHALLFLDADREKASTLTGAGNYKCFGGPDLKSPQLLHGWAPGGQPLEFPAGAATKVPAGALLVMQMHYHPTGKGAELDRTKVQLEFFDGVPDYLATAVLIGNFDKAEGNGMGLLPGADDPGGKPTFVIPAGKAGHTESMSFTLPFEFENQLLEPLQVFAVAPHMHIVGKSMDIRVQRNTTAEYCPSDTLNPFIECYLGACSKATPAEASACAQASCAKQYAALPPICTACLGAMAKYKTGGVQEVIASCATPPAIALPKDECFVDSQTYRFYWQRFYAFDAPVEKLSTLRPGDTLVFNCLYDNSMANPLLAAELSAQGLSLPQPVTLGETTLSEMCLVGLQLLSKNPEAKKK